MFHRIIEEISKELNIKCTYLSKDWIIKLEKDDHIEYIVGNKFPENNHALGLIMDDKYALYEIINNLNIPVCKHYIFYNESNDNPFAKMCHNKKDIYKCFTDLNNDVVVKINNGCEGKDVYHIKDIQELDKRLEYLFKNNYSVSICPFYNIKNEYRLVVLDNEIKLMYKKIRPIVIGNGTDSIKDLLIKFNPKYFKNKSLSNRILKEGQKYMYDWRFNLSRGSICSEEIDPIVKETCTKIASQITSKTGISFATIDIIETSDNDFLVLEINSGVTLNKCIDFIDNGFEIAKDIYKSAIIKLFRC